MTHSSDAPCMKEIRPSASAKAETAPKIGHGLGLTRW